MPELQSAPSWASKRLKKPGSLRTIIGIAIVIVVAIVIGIALTFLNKTGRPAGGAGGGGGGPGGRQAITVGTAKAALGQIPITIDALGTVTPPVTATITTRIAGTLMSVNFTEGQMVRKGQLLAQIDPRPYKVALEQAEGTLAHDQAILANAQVDLKRYQTLLSQQSIASQQVDTQAALVKQDQALLVSDQAQVDNAKLNLAYTSITAPVAGRVGLRQVDVGNYIPAGSTAGLVVITQIDPIDIVFAVPEDDVPQLTRRQGAALPVTALNRDGGAQLAQGTLSTLDNQIDTGTGTIKAKARFDNGSGVLFPNQFVNVHILVNTLCNVVVVPTTAVRHGSQGDFVYTVQPDKTAKMQFVKTGPGTPETVSIVTGVTAGDVVITDGGDRLRDGSTVTLPGDKPQAAQAPGQGRGGRRGFGQSGQRRGGGRGGAGGRGGQGGRRGGGQGAAGQAGPGAAAGGPVDATTAQTTLQTLGAGGSCQGGDAGGGRNGGGHNGGGFGANGGQAPGGHRGQGGPGGPGGQGGQGGQGQGGQGQGGQGQGGRGQGGRGHRGQGGQEQAGQGQGGQNPADPSQPRRHRQGQGQGQQQPANGSAG